MSSTATLTNDRPIVFGELLFDEFDDGIDVLGGAPFNVAWHLQGFGLQPLLISRVGADELGRQVLDTLRHRDMDARGIQIDAEHPTGRVQVRTQNGQPSFTILPDQSYDFIDETDTRRALRGVAAALFYHGSLAARGASAVALMALRNRLDVPVFVDINLREPWWRHESVMNMLQGARWLKLNDGELSTLLKRPLATVDDLVKGADELRDHCGCEWLMLTLGAQGAMLLSDDKQYSAAATVPVEIVDTVGAGDAFSSVMILGIILNWDMPICLQRAVDFAAAVCAQRGATSREHALYTSHLERWAV